MEGPKTETTLERTGENSAGYPVFMRVKREAEVVQVAPEPEVEKRETQQTTEDKGEVTMSRRGFLRKMVLGGAAAGALGAIPVLFKDELGADVSPAEVETENVASTTNEELVRQEVVEENIESTETFSDSMYFYGVINGYADEYARELPLILDYANKITRNDPENRTRLEYVAQELDVDAVPELVQAELKRMIVGLCLEESRFNAARVSGTGAKGLMQFMPATWRGHSAPEANPLSLIDQVAAAESVFAEKYKYLHRKCEAEFEAIEAEFFHGDSAAFEKYFLTPVLINSYNAGQGNMKKLVEWFTRTYGTQESTIALYGQEAVLSGYDVFLAMVDRANQEGAVVDYKEQASTYALKVYGATKCLEDHMSGTQQA